MAGKKHSAMMVYAFTPPFEVKVKPEQKEGEKRELPKRGVSLERGEILADGEDELGLIAYVHRTDEPDPDKAVVDLEIVSWDLKLEGAPEGDFRWERDTQFTEPGKRRFTVESRAPHLYRGVEPDPLTVTAKVKFKLPGKAGDTQEVELSAELRLRRRFLYLKLWVVSGERPGSSEAVAYVCLAPDPKQALKGVTLVLETSSGGSGSLEVAASFNAAQKRCETDASGIAAWVLQYNGLRWDNLDQASFTVKVGPQEPVFKRVEESTEVTIHVGNNVRDLLAALQSDRRRPELNLDNPSFLVENANSVYQAVEFVFPDYLSGPVVNAASWVVPSYAQYACAHLAGRIGGWIAGRKLVQRGADPETFVRMNGVEFQQYSVWYLPMITHHFAGIYLAGADSEGDPRFLDPWWNQEWSSPKYLSADGLYTMIWERLNVVSSQLGTVVILMVAAKLVALALGCSVFAAMTMVKTAGGAAFSGAGCSATLGEDPTNTTLDAAGGYIAYSKEWKSGAVQRLRAAGPVGAVSPLGTGFMVSSGV